MNDATVRRVVRDKIADGRLPVDRTGSVSATNAPSQSRLKKCCIGSPMNAQAGSSFTLRVLPSGEMSGTR